MTRRAAAMLAALLLAVSAAACAPRPVDSPTSGSEAGGAGGAPAATPASPTTPTPTPAMPGTAGSSDATPALASPTPAAPGAAPAPSLACRNDADCAVKDVGSCCGYRPACVNADAQTFPEQVRSRCAAQDRMGICGFPAISGCRCVSGSCAAAPEAIGPAGPAPLQ